jgi:hypothetical protein
MYVSAMCQQACDNVINGTFEVVRTDNFVDEVESPGLFGPDLLSRRGEPEGFTAANDLGKPRQHE